MCVRVSVCPCVFVRAVVRFCARVPVCVRARACSVCARVLVVLPGARVRASVRVRVRACVLRRLCPRLCVPVWLRACVRLRVRVSVGNCGVVSLPLLLQFNFSCPAKLHVRAVGVGSSVIVYDNHWQNIVF